LGTFARCGVQHGHDGVLAVEAVGREVADAVLHEARDGTGEQLFDERTGRRRRRARRRLEKPPAVVFGAGHLEVAVGVRMSRRSTFRRRAGQQGAVAHASALAGSRSSTAGSSRARPAWSDWRT
jgi:hypothetical protein